MAVIPVVSTPARDLLTAYEDAQPILTALADVLPSALKGPDEATRRKEWPAWVASHDREIRERLDRGDDDTLINWLLFGSSFTMQPRAFIDVRETSPEFQRVLSARLLDLIVALAETDRDERREIARQVLRKLGYQFDLENEQRRLAQHLGIELSRVLAEQQALLAQLNAARQSGNVEQERAAESRMFRERGISLDTSIFQGFAIEKALETIRDERHLPARSVRRVAIIGPGLDFPDRNSGYDFYPIQTLQPFTVVDSLVRLGLASRAETVDVTTFDISSRVNDHVHRVRERGLRGDAYLLQVPLENGVAWTPAFLTYWRAMGDRIGAPALVPKPRLTRQPLENRGIRVRPQVAARLTAVELNVVTERWNGAPFDIVVATNVLSYYDRLDQALAFAGIEAMLRPGGFFLANSEVAGLPGSRLRANGSAAVTYSHDRGWPDRMFWYRRQ